jgi:tRNA dimethylallyltransferase
MTASPTRPAVVIAGPTASGKSALALRVAETFDGVVINADSMQVYDGLRILTARPGSADEARAPHRLYGCLPPGESCSAGQWRTLAAAQCEAAWADGRLPVVVGGTGLYIRALTEGLSPIPDIPDEIRADARALFAELGNAAFHAALAERDPLSAARLHPGNSQRLVRAWEVMAGTGRSLAEWQDEPPVERLEAAFLTIVLSPPREILYDACDRRFLAMLDQGALAEVAALRDLRLDPALPVMKALGVPELTALLQGEIDHDDAISLAQRATRRYAKRQTTWFRHQVSATHTLNTQFSESFSDGFFSIIRQFLLTPH